MGKYHINGEKDWSLAEAVGCMANELAESNRLKRVEIRIDSHYNDHIDGGDYDEIIKDLEDKA